MVSPTSLQKPSAIDLTMPVNHLTYSIEDGLLLRQSDTHHIRETQLKLLRRHLCHAQQTPHYAQLFNKINLDPQTIACVEDIRQIPLTSRGDIEGKTHQFSPSGISIRDISHTSGTTGNPVIVPYTTHDLQRLAYNEAMAFYSAGVRNTDTILLTVTLDRCFIAGLAYYTGATLLGATAIRSGPGQPAQQWQLIKKLQPTVLLGVPSFLLSLARWGKNNGFDSTATGIRAIVTIGEPVRSPDFSHTTLGRLLHKSWNAPIFSSYGATEVETAFGDCTNECGSHVHPELMLLEIIDEHGNIQPDGEPGEVVVTPLGVEGFPLVRFQTGDIARKHTSSCQCGWNTERLGPIEGRISQRLKYKGTTLYPEMILQALQEIPGSEDSYIEVRETFDLADDITVVIGSDEDSFDLKHFQDILQARLRVRPKIEKKTVEEVVLKTGKGKLRKPTRFFDHR